MSDEMAVKKPVVGKSQASKGVAGLKRLSDVAKMATQEPDGTLKLSKIYTVKQVRTQFRDLESLAQSIRENGIIEPLIVHEEVGGRYRLIIGERRFRSAPMADLDEVPVIVKKGLTELEIRKLQVAENKDRDDLTLQDEAAGVVEDVKLYGVPEAMRIWNKSEGWISKRMASENYGPKTREVFEGDLCGDFEVLHSLNQLEGMDSTHRGFVSLITKLANGGTLSREEVRDAVSARRRQLEDEAARESERLLREKQGALPGVEEGHDQEVEPAFKAAASATKEEEPRESLPAGKEKQDIPEQHTNAGLAAEQGHEHGPIDKPLSAKKTPTKVNSNHAVESLGEARLRMSKEGLIQAQDRMWWRGLTVKAELQDMTKLADILGMTMTEVDWLLWSSFLTTVLPGLEAVGEERAGLFIKKLVGSLKGKQPGELMNEIFPLKGETEESRDRAPAAPDDWHL